MITLVIGVIILIALILNYVIPVKTKDLYCVTGVTKSRYSIMLGQKADYEQLQGLTPEQGTRYDCNVETVKLHVF